MSPWWELILTFSWWELINIMSPWWELILTFLGGFGVISFGWNIYSYKKEQAGFLTPKLECSSKSNANEKYILSKTSLKNTSRRRIMVVHAFLLIVDQSVSYDDAIELMKNYVSKNVCCFLQLKMHGRMFQHLADMAMVMECVFRSSERRTDEKRERVRKKVKETDDGKMFECLAESFDLLEAHSTEGWFIIKMLPYYYKQHIWLGSFADMATSHIQTLKHNGVCSVYFAILGENWYTKGDTSQGRFVHDEVIVQ
jgi:hypothetical protein